MKVWLKKGLDSGHDNFLREMEIPLLLDYRLYLWLFPFAIDELLEMNMPPIQKEDMIMTDPCKKLTADCALQQVYKPLLNELF
jgi:hypothetical protein